MTPRAQERVFEKSYGEELIKIARSDLFSARVLYESMGTRLETVGFHCQQAIEKAIKSVLISKGVPVPMVHDAGILVAKLPEALTPPKGYDLSQLSSFATHLRYEEGKMKISRKEMEAILAIGESVLRWAETLI